MSISWAKGLNWNEIIKYLTNSFLLGLLRNLKDENGNWPLVIVAAV